MAYTEYINNTHHHKVKSTITQLNSPSSKLRYPRVPLRHIFPHEGSCRKLLKKFRQCCSATSAKFSMINVLGLLLRML